MAKLLDVDAITSALDRLPGWEHHGDCLVRTVGFPSFPAAIEVVDRVAQDAEERAHHPDIDIRWRTLTFRLSTHSAGGLTAKDIELAEVISARIDATRP